MRIQVLDMPQGRRFAWHLTGLDMTPWALHVPKNHHYENLSIKRDGVVVHEGQLEVGSFGYIDCFVGLPGGKFGKRVPKLYAALLQAGDEIVIAPSTGNASVFFDKHYWFELLGMQSVPQELPYSKVQEMGTTLAA